MMKVQTIGHDKVNQLRHVRFFKNIHGIVEHMKKHADILRPKFEAVLDVLERELGGLEMLLLPRQKKQVLYLQEQAQLIHMEKILMTVISVLRRLIRLRKNCPLRRKFLY